LAAEWKVPVVVDNKAGASGKLAADAVARAPADGHTLLLGAVSVVTNPPLYRTPPYVPQSLRPLGVGVASQLVTIARPNLPAKDVPGLIALSASSPAGLNGASPGTGTLSHLGLEMLVLNHRARISHVPYRGSGPALTDIMGGQTDVMIDAITSAAPAIASGKAKAIAVHTPQRAALLPGVPTYEEQGVKGMAFGAWNIFLVPSRTPPERIATLHAALACAIRDPAVSKALSERALDAIVQSPEESIEFMRREAQRWEKVIRDANVTP
jgi:tripartite-type tricarboxylate transporter receptor subunit TctC